MKLSELINEILSEWEYRVDNGLPNPKNIQHIRVLSEVLDIMGLTHIKEELIQNLLEDDKGFKNPALNKVVKYKSVNGEDAEGKVGNLLRRPKEEDAYQKAVATLGGKDSDTYKKAMGDLGGEGQPEKEVEKEKEDGDSKETEEPKKLSGFDPQTKGGESYLKDLPNTDPAKPQSMKPDTEGVKVAKGLAGRKTEDGDELDVETTENGSILIGVEHGADKESNKQAIEQIKKLPKDTKVMFVGEGGMSRDIDDNIEFGGEQDEFRNAVKGHFENSEESSWDENANITDDTSPVFDEVASVVGGSKSKAKASIWSNMYGQDGKDAEMKVDDYLDDEGKDWLVGEAKKGGSKEFDGEVDWNNLTDEQQKDLYELNYRDDNSYGETEISKGQESYNNFRQKELDRKIKEAEDAGFTVIAPVGNSHVDMFRQRKMKEKADAEARGGLDYLKGLPDTDPAKSDSMKNDTEKTQSAGGVVYPLGGGYYADTPGGVPKYRKATEEGVDTLDFRYILESEGQVVKKVAKGGGETVSLVVIGDKEKEKAIKSKKLTDRQQEITQSLNNGDFSELIKASDEVHSLRDEGIAGAGGSVASYGESALTRAANDLKGDGYTKFKETNKEAIEVEKKNILAKAKANARKIKEVSKQLGYELPEDEEEVIEYIAERKVYGDLELERLKSNPNSLWYNEGTSGFNQPDEAKKEKAFRDWANAQFDGAHATLYEIENGSNIDPSQPYYTIQSNPKEGGEDAAISAHLQNKYEEAKESGNEEDIAHYEQEIRAFEKLGFHDTMAVGKDKNGRTTVLHITNKKANDLKDMWANTTPAFMLGVIKKSFGSDVSEAVISIIDDGIVKCADGKQATNRAFASMKIDENFVKISEIEDMKPYMNELKANKKFKKWAESNGVDLETTSNEEVLASAQQYMKSEEASGRTVGYKPFGKILTKVGEFAQQTKIRQKYSDINFDSESIALAVKNKNDEKDLVGAVHSDVVNAISEADKEKGFPDENGNNGPHTQAYIATAMRSMHFDLMVENFDKNLSAVTGIRGSRPEDFRGCLAELSGYAGDIESKEGRDQLNQHLLKKCKINATTGFIEITNPNGNISLVEDSWRTSGETKKVEKKLGDGLSQCVASKVDSRKKRK